MKMRKYNLISSIVFSIVLAFSFWRGDGDSWRTPLLSDPIVLFGLISLAIYVIVGMIVNNQKPVVCLERLSWMAVWATVAWRLVPLTELASVQFFHGQTGAVAMYVYATAFLLFGGLAVANLFGIFFELLEEPQREN